jgi:hypothetical protein
MITTREALEGLYGAWRLARNDRQGMGFFVDSLEAFWRSFWAAAIAAPGYAILVAIHLDGVEDSTGPERIVLVQAIAYVCGWTAFPLAMHFVADAIDRSENYVRYIIANNWATALQVGLYVVVAALLAMGDFPNAVAVPVSLGAHIAVIVYQWNVARIALEIGGRAAAAIVFLDFVISLLINSIVRAML